MSERRREKALIIQRCQQGHSKQAAEAIISLLPSSSSRHKKVTVIPRETWGQREGKSIFFPSEKVSKCVPCLYTFVKLSSMLWKPKLELGIHLRDHVGLVELPGYGATARWRLQPLQWPLILHQAELQFCQGSKLQWRSLTHSLQILLSTQNLGRIFGSWLTASCSWWCHHSSLK